VEELARIVERAKNDDETRNALIQDYTPFILKTASGFSKRYIDKRVDEEYSIGLIAFNEAIDRFESSRGISFLTFARTIIRRRLIDHYRKDVKVRNQIYLEVSDEEKPGVEYSLSMERFRARIEQEERMNEITEYSKDLLGFGITFSSLVKICPRKKDARERAVEAAKAVAADPDLYGYLIEKKMLPLKEIEKRVPQSRKTLERHRNYIIAIVLILAGDYYYLQDYIKGIEG